MNKVKKVENKAIMQYDSFKAGQAVRDLREAKGWTIEKLAEEVDKSESHIHQLELGEAGRCRLSFCLPSWEPLTRMPILYWGFRIRSAEQRTFP